MVPNWLTFASVSHWFKFSVPPQKWDARNYYNLVHKSAVTMLAFDWTKKNIKHLILEEVVPARLSPIKKDQRYFYVSKAVLGQYQHYRSVLGGKGTA